MPREIDPKDFEALLYASLAIQDKLSCDVDHATFCGSMNDVESFKETVNVLWNKYYLISPAKG